MKQAVNFPLLPLLLVIAFCTSGLAWAGDCPGLYSGAPSDAGGSNEICALLPESGSDHYRLDCNLAANELDGGDNQGAWAWATTWECGGDDYCVFGEDIKGNKFCVLANGCDIWKVVVRGTDLVNSGDHIFLYHVQSYLTTACVDDESAHFIQGVVFAGTGPDYIGGSPEDESDKETDHLYGNAGNDEVHGRAGGDFIDGGSGYNTLWGGCGDDEIWGGDNGNWVDAGCGDDTVNTGDGNDILAGQGGDDTMNSRAGDDVLCGGPGGDTLIGGDGGDLLWCGDDDEMYETNSGGNGTDYCDSADVRMGCEYPLASAPTECPTAGCYE